MEIEKNKRFDEVTFRLFWDDKPVGFENWNIFSPLCNYTYGDPTKESFKNGWKTNLPEKLITWNELFDGI